MNHTNKIDAIPAAAYSRTFLHMIFFSNLDARLRISSIDIRVPSTGGCCQSCCMEVLGVSVTALSSLVVETGQNALDAMDPGCHIACREPGYFSDLSRVQSFQIRQDHVAVERLELVDQLKKLVQGECAISGRLARLRIWQAFELLQSDECLRTFEVLTRHVGCANVVRHAIDPGAQGTAPVECAQAAPQRN